MKRKYKKLLTIIFFLFVITLFFGISFAIYKSAKDNEEASIVLTDEYLSINFLDGKSFEEKELKPNDVVSRRVSVTNVNSSKTFLTINLMDINKTSNDLSLVVLDNDKNTIYDKKITNIDTVLLKGVDIEPGKTLSYTIMVKNDSNEVASFYANILVYKEIIKQSNNTFKDTLLENSQIKDYAVSMISGISNTDEGLIKTTDDLGESYVFRGNVLNNNLNFGGFNWKIVRINGDNTIRLVLFDALDNQVAYNDNSEETDNYQSKLFFKNSKIKGELDNFLSSNLQEVSKYIVDSIFCEDTTTFKEENDIIYLNPYNRVFTDNTPTLACMGNKISEKIGLLTVDEVVMAGAFQTNSNQNFYLFNGAINGPWWTLSGSQIIKKNNVVDAVSVNKDGSLNYEKKISTPLYVRPVISIDSNTVVSGDGTLENPYTIKQ